MRQPRQDRTSILPLRISCHQKAFFRADHRTKRKHLSVRDTWTIDCESFRELKSSMTARVQRNFGRSATVAIAICSWLAISNHCAFARRSSRRRNAKRVSFHSKPAKQKSIRLGYNAARLCARLFRRSQKAGHEMILIFPMSIFTSKNCAHRLFASPAGAIVSRYGTARRAHIR